MSKIQIQNAMVPDMVTVPGAFIKHYMAKASGEFVKIYLYLYYMVTVCMEAELSEAADALLCTESDILRALKYWENQGLLQLQRSTDGAVQALTFLQIPDMTPTGRDALVHSSRSEQEASAASQISSIHLEHDSGFQELCFLAQAYTKKTLSSRDTQRLGYWYQLYNGSFEVIEYLLEYCIELGHPSFNYMEKVLLNWHENGYATVSEIKEHSKAHNVITYRVMGAFGLKDRNPGVKEAEFIQKWYHTYGFSVEMIEFACQKTLSAIQKPSFEYTDSILTAWHKNELTTPELVTAFEQKRKQKDTSSASAASRPAQSRIPKKTTGNKFHNFEQHDTDYSQLLSDYYGVKLP